jgi:hypothetical protein
MRRSLFASLGKGRQGQPGRSAPTLSGHFSSSFAMVLASHEHHDRCLCNSALKFRGIHLAAESCGACLRREQARCNLTEDMLIVSNCRPLHMNTSALYACFLRQPLELTLKKDF